MSKAVKSVGRAIKKVVSGIGKAVKKVVKSKIGKIILAAAAIYFGGPMLMGAFEGATGAATAAGAAGSAAGGGLSGALAGAGAGLSSATSGIASAWSALMEGSITGAGSSLASGFSGTAVSGELAQVAAGANAASAAAANPITGLLANGGSSAGAAFGASTGFDAMAGGQGLDFISESTPSFMTYSDGTGVGSSLSAAKLPAPTSSGLLASIMNSPYTAPALISGGTQLVGGLLQGYGASQAQKEKLAQDEALRRQYGINIGYDAGWKKYG